MVLPEAASLLVEVVGPPDVAVGVGDQRHQNGVGVAIDELLGHHRRRDVADVGVLGRDAVTLLEQQHGRHAPVTLGGQAHRYTLALEICDALDVRVEGDEKLALGHQPLTVEQLELDWDRLGNEGLQVAAAPLESSLNHGVLGAEDRSLPAPFLGHGAHVVHEARRFLGGGQHIGAAPRHLRGQHRLRLHDAAAQGAGEHGNNRFGPRWSRLQGHERYSGQRHVKRRCN